MTIKDTIKGRLKRAAGELTDNDRLKKQGRTDEVVGDAKDTVDDLTQKMEDTADRAKKLISKAGEDHADKRQRN